LSYYVTFHEKFVHTHCCVCLLKDFKISQHLAKLQTRNLIVSRAQCVWALSCWKTKNSPDILSIARNSWR